jgi:hypothetical protein
LFNELTKIGGSVAAVGGMSKRKYDYVEMYSDKQIKEKNGLWYLFPLVQFLRRKKDYEDEK